MEVNYDIFSNQQLDELEITCDDELNLEFTKEVMAEATELASKVFLSLKIFCNFRKKK